MLKEQIAMVEFAVKYPGWHSYTKDRLTMTCACALYNLGILEFSHDTIRQFRLKSEKKAKSWLASKKGE